MNSFSTNPKDIRKFGFILMLLAGTLGTLAIIRQRGISIYLFGFLSFLGLALGLMPDLLKPVYVGWLNMGQRIGRGITSCMLVLAYYIVITPTGLAKSFFGGRPLPLKPDEKAISYWIKRSEPCQSKERFEKRY